MSATAGLLGAGRTRLLRTIFGLETVRSGRIRVGVYSGPASPSARWAQGAGMLSEPSALTVPALSDLVVDIHIPGDTGSGTSPLIRGHTTYAW